MPEAEKERRHKKKHRSSQSTHRRHSSSEHSPRRSRSSQKKKKKSERSSSKHRKERSSRSSKTRTRLDFDPQTNLTNEVGEVFHFPPVTTHKKKLMTEDPAATAQPQSSLEVAARAPEAPRAPSPTMRPAPRPKAPGEEDRRFPRFVSDAVDTVARTLAAEEEVDMFFFGQRSMGSGVWGRDLSTLCKTWRFRSVCQYRDRSIPTSAFCRIIVAANDEPLYAAAFENASDMGSAGYIAVWSTSMYTRAERVLVAPASVRALEFLSESQLAAGLSNGMVYVWDLRVPGFLPAQKLLMSEHTSDHLQKVAAIHSPVVGLRTVRPSGQAPQLICAYETGELAEWAHPLTSAPRMSLISSSRRYVTLSTAYHPDLGYIAAGNIAGAVVLKRMGEKCVLRKDPAISGPITSLAFAGTDFLLAGSPAGDIATFKITHDTCGGNIEKANVFMRSVDSTLNTLAPSPSGHVLAVTDGDGVLSLYDMRDLSQQTHTRTLQPLLRTSGVDPRACALEWLDEQNLLVPHTNALIVLLRIEVADK
eukprot:gnl/Chilomastix_cuspidata/3008.p1 GENE.gnl/Chilomastix_cuspidata/3008~~gnl/Chilomastix_cuspidata/3008.p1  ORF type:complete len:533 (-),score=107.13 gnl/Chilomastix_cuspidata/3008:887-2485(-)